MVVRLASSKLRTNDSADRAFRELPPENFHGLSLKPKTFCYDDDLLLLALFLDPLILAGLLGLLPVAKTSQILLKS